jgi:hypothetical protein
MKLKAAVLVLASIGSACGSADQTPLSDGGVRGDAAGGRDANATDGGSSADATAPYDGGTLSPIPGGGATGGPIAGHLTVFTIDRASGQPVEGARVVAVAQTKTASGATDASGRIDLSDPGLIGPLTVHVFAATYTYQTDIGVNAQQLTFAMGKQDRTITSTAAKISGTVGGWNVLPATTSTQSFHFGAVTAIGKTFLGASLMQDMRPMTNIATNTVVENLYPTYMLKVDAATTVGVGLIGGTITLRRNMAPSVQITHAGFLTTVMPMSGATDSGRDVNFSVPLSQELSMTVSNPPAQLQGFALVEVALPSKAGYYPLAFARIAATGTATATAPALSGTLAGGSYLAAALYQDATATKASVAVSRNNAGGTISVTGFLALPDAISAARRTISATPSPGAQFTTYDVRKNGNTLWTIASVQPTSFFTLPSVPSGLDDPLTGMADVSVTSIDAPGFDANNFTGDSVLDAVRAYAQTTAPVTFSGN